MTSLVWNELVDQFPASWLRVLEQRDVDAEAFDVTTATIAGWDVTPDERKQFADLESTALALLERLERDEWLTSTMTYRCPICFTELHENIRDGICPNVEVPSHAFTDDGHDGPIAVRIYRRSGIPKRAVGWLLALHGMNTRAAWQESFNWLVSTSYGRMVPVAIYKYGIVRPGVLFRQRHNTMMRQVASHIRRAGLEASEIVDDHRPDVIAHSFGTLLLGKALQQDPELRVRRIITLGSILRPDFDWGMLIERNQVEAVLNNHGTRDLWARMSHFTIPDAGPSGFHGFDSNPRSNDAVINVPAQGFTHSMFFEDVGESPTILRQQFAKVWQPFLTTSDIADIKPRLMRLGNTVVWPEEKWRQSRWPVRAFTGGWDSHNGSP